MKRREFVRSMGASPAVLAAGLSSLPFIGCSRKQGTKINKREAFLEFVHGFGKQDYFPGAFFIHFGEEHYFGPTAISKHLDYFRAIGGDILKVQYERRFPFIESLTKPSDWANVPLLKKEFYADQLKVIEGIVREGKGEAMVIPTVYSPLSFAGHFTAYQHHINHLNEDPEAVKKGLEIITESTLVFVEECIKLGVDGFFQASQGGELNRFENDQTFEQYIKPFDLVIAEEIAAGAECNILHMHNGGEGYSDYSAFVDYPCHVINCGLHLANASISTQDLYTQFRKPIMGGFDRAGVIYSGSDAEIAAEAKRILSEAPERFAL